MLFRAWLATRRDVAGDNYLSHLFGGLDAQLSGQLWWSVDIGGYSHPMDAETMGRDWMLGATAPIMRQHGDRDTRIYSGFSNEKAAIAAIRLRMSLREYVHKQLTIASERGIPMQRYLWHDFPEDEVTWDIGDQFMFGSDYLVAPIVVQKTLSRSVYFPGRGLKWQHYKNSSLMFAGRTSAVVAAETDDIPMFKK
eukprot:COSAG02_NODE_7779_length_2849_cov_1.717091_1_plen_194_part_10